MSNYNLEKILPHDYPMLLLDDIVSIDIEHLQLTSTFTINSKKLFFDKTNNGVSSLVGLEFMAQTIGCYAYFRRQQNKPQIGLLLGTRLFNNAIDYFKNGETYTVKVHEVFTDSEIVAFECLIYDKNNEEIESATINAYQSDNIERLLVNNG